MSADTFPQRNSGKGIYGRSLTEDGPRLFEILQKDETGKTWGTDIESTFKAFAAHDPTAADPVKPYRDLAWLCKKFLQTYREGSRGIKGEDLYKVHDDLMFFYNFKKRYPHVSFEKNIHCYTIDTLADFVFEKQVAPIVSNTESKKKVSQQIRTETEFLYSGPEGVILIPKTKQASQFWGQGTRWCTAATLSKNYFDSYNQSGPLVIYIPAASAKDTAYERKFQGHCKSSLMNAADRMPKTLSKGFKSLITAAITQNPELAQVLRDKGSLLYRHIPDESHTPETWLSWLQEKYESGRGFFQLLKRIPEKIWADAEFTNDVCKIDGRSFYSVPKQYRSPASQLALLKSADGRGGFKKALQDTPIHYFEDFDFCKGLFAIPSGTLQHVPESCRTIAVVQAAFESLETAGHAEDIAALCPTSYWNDDAFCTFAFSQHIPLIMRFPEAAWSLDRILKALPALKKSGQEAFHAFIEKIPKHHWENSDLGFEICDYAPVSLNLVPKPWRTRTLCIFALQKAATPNQRKTILKAYPQFQANDHDFLCEIMVIDPQLLSSIPKRNRTQTLCMAAFEKADEKQTIIACVPEVFWNDELFKSALVDKNFRNLGLIPIEARSPETCRNAFQKAAQLAENLTATSDKKKSRSILAETFNRIPGPLQTDPEFCQSILDRIPAAKDVLSAKMRLTLGIGSWWDRVVALI